MRAFQKNIYLIASLACIVVALGCYFAHRANAAFVIATLGIVAWFLNQKRLIRERADKAER